jgi:C4-dicarboxylate-specific signal transduction histidine kinase
MKLLFLRLLGLGLVFGVSATAFGTPTAPAANETEPAERKVDVRVLLSAVGALADHHLKCLADALAVAAQGQEVRSLEWERIRPLLAVVQERFGPATVWWAKPDGSYFNVEKGLIDANLKDRPYFPKLMAGEASVGELVVSRSTGGNTVIAAVPVIEEGRVVGALGASLSLDALAQRLRQAAPLPEGFVFYALDAKGQIALHTRENRIFQEAMELGSPTLTEAVRKMLTTSEGVVRYEFEGGRQNAVYQTSALTGWKFALRFPAE